MSFIMRFYHVTDRENAQSILQEGFEGGWGDVGFGVYFYGDLVSACRYLEAGGWDHDLTDPVILEVHDENIQKVVPHPDWPSEKYTSMYWFEMDEDGDEVLWRPPSLRQLPETEYQSKMTQRRKMGPR